MHADPHLATANTMTMMTTKTKTPFATRRSRNRHIRYTVLALAVAALAQNVQSQQAYAPITDNARTPVMGVPTPLYPMATPDLPLGGQASVVFAGRQGVVDYSVNKVAARVIVEVARNAVPADGQTPVLVTVNVLGADGKPLTQPVWATIEHSGGRIQLPGAKTDEFGPLGKDADRTATGVQVEVKGGSASFMLLAPVAPQEVLLRVTVGAQEASGVVSFVPEMRDMVAAGLLEGIINFSGKTTGLLQRPTREDAFDREIRAWGREFNGGKANLGARAAFFLKGTIQGKYLLTAAYDSDKETRNRLLRDIKTEEFYPVYGDSSLRGEEAVANSRLYVRVDKDRNYLLWGDFSTGDGFSQRSGGGTLASLQQRSLGNYNRSATGIRYHRDENGYVGNVFAFRDSLRQAVEEFASQGSGPYGLRNGAVLEGSEKVEILVRDRNQPSRILTATPLARLNDYTFEPFSGRILLNTFLPSADSNLNPTSLRVTYEVEQGGETFWVVGADGQLRLSDSLEVGGSLVKDSNPLAPQQLGSANISLRLSPTTMIVAEVARTTGQVNTNTVNATTSPGLAGRTGEVSGNAWRVELAHQGEQTEARAFVGRSDPTFNNLAAPLTGGRSEASVFGGYKLSDSVRLYGRAERSENRNLGGADKSAAQIGAELKLSDRLTMNLGLRTMRESAGSATALFSTPFSSTTGLTGSIATGSGGSAVGFGNQTINPASGLPVISSGTSLAGTAAVNATGLRSDTAMVGLGFKINDRLTIGGEVEHSISGMPRNRYSIGGDYQMGERTRLYGRYERQTGLSGDNSVSTSQRNSNALIFGVNSSVFRETQVFSEYRLRDAISGRDAQAASGIRNSWDYAPGIRLNTAFERTQVIAGTAPDTYAISAGVDYTAQELWKGSSKIEYRRAGDVKSTIANEGFSTTLWQVMAARKLDRDWTLLARNYMLATDYDARGDVFQNRAQIGIAYRDTDTNRVNALAKYELKVERDGSNAAVGNLSSVAHIVSGHADYHPTRPLWLTGRAAAKWQQDQFENGIRDSFNAQLFSGRVVYDLDKKWDIGLMAAVQMGQRNARQSALGIELGYQMQENLWLSIGYNRSGFSADNDLVGYEYTRAGAYIRLRFKFDENLFAASKKPVNPSIDR